MRALKSINLILITALVLSFPAQAIGDGAKSDSANDGAKSGSAIGGAKSGSAKSGSAKSSPRSNTNWPRLITKSPSPECDQVLAAAKLAFASTSSEMDDSSEAIEKGNIGLILASQVPDNPGGNLKFWFDPTYIEAKEPKGNSSDSEAKGTAGASATEGNASDSAAAQANSGDSAGDDLICSGVRRILWQKSPTSGGRFVVAQFPMNWQGDWYGLYLVDAKMAPEKLQAFVSGVSDGGQDEMKGVAGATLIYNDCWHQPFLFHNSKTDRIVAVDTKAQWLTSNKFFPDWAIYVAAGGAHVKHIGTISFTPTARAVDLLPNGPLREIAFLLDKIIGKPRADEGTFHATPRLRAVAQIAWGNLMLRPWAMATPPNSKEQVEQGLKQWQKGSPVYRQQYQQLHQLYPKALDSLTAYYQGHFHKPFKAAHDLAVKSLEVAYRSNFSF